MTQKQQQTAISPRRDEDFPEWYQQVIKAADLAENSPVRGAMVIKPWGYTIWELVQKVLDHEIKKRGHVNAYFPLFIPLSFLEKEAAHVDGFAKECAVVTHTRLEEKNGALIPTAPLEEPYIIRPTSETIIGDCYSRWIESYRDLPMMVNQWANVVRWEMRPRIFLRTTEFLWQEGHTAHATKEEALAETMDILDMYRQVSEDVLAMPVIVGEKSPGERFPGADNTFSIEAMMQDRKGLQAGTSHYLGQNFSKASNITYSDKDGELKYCYTTSWGVTTRLLGGVIMTHSDDDGLRLPPRIAPKQVVIIPFVPKAEYEADVFKYADALASSLETINYRGSPLRVHVDKRDLRGGEKNWEWIKKGVPLRIEVGPRDIESSSALVARRDRGPKEKESVPVSQIPLALTEWLDDMQNGYLKEATAFREEHTNRTIGSYEDMIAFFTPQCREKPEIHGGFVLGKWCGDASTEAQLKEHQLAIRCIPLEQSETEGKCLITGRSATLDVIYGKAY